MANPKQAEKVTAPTEAADASDNALVIEDGVVISSLKAGTKAEEVAKEYAGAVLSTKDYGKYQIHVVGTATSTFKVRVG